MTSELKACRSNEDGSLTISNAEVQRLMDYGLLHRLDDGWHVGEWPATNDRAALSTRSEGQVTEARSKDEMESRREHVRSEIQRCHEAISEGGADQWWYRDLYDLEKELDELNAALASTQQGSTYEPDGSDAPVRDAPAAPDDHCGWVETEQRPPADEDGEWLRENAADIAWGRLQRRDVQNRLEHIAERISRRDDGRRP